MVWILLVFCKVPILFDTFYLVLIALLFQTSGNLRIFFCQLYEAPLRLCVHFPVILCCFRQLALLQTCSFYSILSSGYFVSLKCSLQRVVFYDDKRFQKTKSGAYIRQYCPHTLIFRWHWFEAQHLNTFLAGFSDCWRNVMTDSVDKTDPSLDFLAIQHFYCRFLGRLILSISCDVCRSPTQVSFT